jgi:hypothetical protein
VPVEEIPLRVLVGAISRIFSVYPMFVKYTAIAMDKNDGVGPVWRSEAKII